MTQRLRTVWKPKRPLCPESHSSTPTPVSLDEFSPALVMIAAAFSMSLFIMLAENLIRKCLIEKNLLPTFFNSDNRKISSAMKSFESEKTNESIDVEEPKDI